MSRFPLWKVSEGVGETKAAAAAKRAEVPTLLARLGRRGEAERGYLLSHNPWSDREPGTGGGETRAYTTGAAAEHCIWGLKI